MLAEKDGELVVEEKGIYSVEKFLIARRLMYWQVYLHKTVLSAEQMLIQTMKRAKELISQGKALEAPKNLLFFLQKQVSYQDFAKNSPELLDRFATLDDNDVVSALKNWLDSDDKLLVYFANALLNRRLFKLELRNEPFDEAYVDEIRCKAEKWGAFPKELIPYLVFQGKESNSAYTALKDEVKILHKDGSVLPMSANADFGIQSKLVTKYYLCYPKEIVRGTGGSRDEETE